MSDEERARFSDLYAHGEPLDPKGMFQLVTDEAYRNGQVGELERKVLSSLGRFLRIDGPQALAIAARSKKKFDSGELGLERNFDARALYRRVLRYVLSHGILGDRERLMLQALCKLFGISSSEHARLIEEARMEGNTLPAMPIRPGRRGSPPPEDSVGLDSSSSSKVSAVPEVLAVPTQSAPAAPNGGESTAPRIGRPGFDLDRLYPGFVISQPVVGTAGETIAPPFARVRKVDEIPDSRGAWGGIPSFDPSQLGSRVVLALLAAAFLTSFWWLL